MPKHAKPRPRRRWRSGSIAAVVGAAVLFGGGASWAAQATYAMIAGDNLTTTCAGPTLGMHRNSPTSITLKCHTPKPTPSSTPSTTSTPSSSPTPSTTPSSTPTPSTTPTSSGYSCVTSSPSGNCGPYDTNKITNANGYNTYVGNNCWGDPNCKQTTRANGPDDWQVTGTEPANSGAVATYPNVAQLFSDWCPATNTRPAQFNCANASADTPLASLSSLTSSYAETTPHDASMIAQWAWDIWIGNAGSNSDEIMVWTDNANRDPEDAGAAYDSTFTLNGQTWSLYFYGGHGGETIISLGARHAAAQQGSGTVDLKGLLDVLVSKGYQSSNLALGQIDVGWELCSTGGVPKTFTVSDYTLTATPA